MTAGGRRRRRGAVAFGRERESGSFDPATALEQLHGEIVQLEALAHAASAAVEEMPRVGRKRDRHLAERAHALIIAMADAAASALKVADDAIARFDRPMRARRARD